MNNRMMLVCSVVAVAALLGLLAARRDRGQERGEVHVPEERLQLGIAPRPASREVARLGRDLDANDEREDYLRARLSHGDGDELVATPFDKQDSSMQSTMATADCLVVRPPFAPAAKQGERVRFVRL